MRSTLANGVLVTILIILTKCTSPSGNEPEWQKKNEELIEKHDLTKREIQGYPETKIESNLEAAKVKSLDNLDSIGLYEGVNAKVFWGSGTMISILQLAPRCKNSGGSCCPPINFYLSWKVPLISL